ncbi:MAG TPA: Abi-alpha family protein [Planctomycetota bacterium]|mgnify:CR=1 FL=1|nr:Abi-alpha family protein [Planctomycetota bacterium]HRR82017.1 Abi-alpha family protein [Planctomycetota bacterium]HRT95096.1 Abi-alpha family protein [Planctomycetota bacterium]
MSAPDESQTLAKAVGVAREYADIVVKGPLSELGGMLTDVVGNWRLKNRVRIMLRTKRWLEERGVEPRKVLPDVFVPLLEDGGNVEDESLSDMFASLLACHLDPAQQAQVHPSYTKVLAQLSPLDARIMLIFRQGVSDRVARESGLKGHVLAAREIANGLDMPFRAAYLSCLNLERLGIVENVRVQPPKEHPVPHMFEDDPSFQRYRMSEYGVAFCDACHYPSGGD